MLFLHDGEDSVFFQVSILWGYQNLAVQCSFFSPWNYTSLVKSRSESCSTHPERLWSADLTFGMDLNVNRDADQCTPTNVRIGCSLANRAVAVEHQHDNSANDSLWPLRHVSGRFHVETTAHKTRSIQWRHLNVIPTYGLWHRIPWSNTIHTIVQRLTGTPRLPTTRRYVDSVVTNL